MKILYVIFSYNRAKMFPVSIDSLFRNNKLRPDKVLIMEDSTMPEVKSFVFNKHLSDSSIDVFSFGKNVDYGVSAEVAFNLIENYYNPEYVYIIENDYIFAQNGLDIIQELFDTNEFVKEGIGFCGYDSPTFYSKQKTEGDFLSTIPFEFNEEDNLNRSIMYRPFPQKTSFGEINLEFVSNSCSTSYWNWKKIMKIKKEFPAEFDKLMFRILDKHHINTPRYINDGALGTGFSWLWNKWAIKHGIDRNKYAAMLNVKPSVANHINGGTPGETISGYNTPEGTTVASSPSFRWETWNKSTTTTLKGSGL